ncbi:MAG: 50S ribosomal protein L18 [Halanaerobiales bacterium]|nr:50S ribosomal protein L18 [Halanaerobiales bacterium]
MDKRSARKRRHFRIRNKITGTPNKPRMVVNRSLKNMYVQIIDDLTGHTLVAASTEDEKLRDQLDHCGNVEAAKKVGELVAKRALENDINEVVFDRAGYKYHGRVKAVAEAAREEGLNF